MLQSEESPSKKWFTPRTSSTGALHWVFQRFTGVILVLLIGLHMLVVHFIPLGLEAATNFGVASYEATYARLAGGWFFAIDWTLLVLALYHGINGVRMVVLDFSPGKQLNLVFSIVFTLVFFIAVIYGTWILFVVLGNPV